MAMFTASIFLLGCSNLNESTCEEEVLTSAHIMITINGVEQAEFTHTFELTEEINLMDLMKDNYRMSEEDGEIRCIEGNGQCEDSGTIWNYEVNGVPMEVSPEKHLIQDGDYIVWKLTSNNNY